MRHSLKWKQPSSPKLGYVGKEVDSIIRDLTDSAMKLVRQQEIAKNRSKAEDAAEDRILDALATTTKKINGVKWKTTIPNSTHSSSVP